MKRVIPFLCFGLMLCAANQYEEESEVINQYGYVNLGLGPLPFPVPTLGFGYRTQNDRRGIDINGSCVIVAPERVALKLAGRVMFYFNPNEVKQYYAGIGPALSPVFSPFNSSSWAGLGISPEILIGREHLSSGGKKRFWEIVIDFPTFASNSNAYKWGDEGHLIYFPYVYVQYGWGF